MSFFESENMQYSKPHVTTDINIVNRLSHSQLLLSLNDNIIEECLQQILEIFNHNKRDIISLLLHTQKTDKYDQMMTILQNAQLENTENDSSDLKNLDRLPNESIYNICSYLNKSDINSFKTLSIRMALITFDIKKCYRINTFNMNELIEINEYKYQPKLKILEKIKINRFQSFMKYKSLMDLYSVKYKVPFKNILILQIKNKMLPEIDSSRPKSIGQQFIHGNYFNFLTGTILDTNHVDSIIQNKNTLFFFDKTKLFPSTTITKLNNYHIFLIQYFDTKAQLIQNVQFYLCLAYPTEFEIINYIQSKLKCCPNIHKTFAQMKQFSSQQQLINIYDVKTKIRLDNRNMYIQFVPYVQTHDQNDTELGLFDISQAKIIHDNETNSMTEENHINCTFSIILFELNDKHSFFQTQSLKQYDYDKNSSKPFYSNIINFNFDHNLAQTITVENKAYSITNISIIVTPLTTYKMVKNKIRNKILEMCKEEISSSNIEIFRNTKRIASETELILPLSYAKIAWSIVPYCTEGALHKVFIYDHQIINCWKQSEDNVQSFDSCFLCPQTESITFEMRHKSQKQRQYTKDLKIDHKYKPMRIFHYVDEDTSEYQDNRMENQLINIYAPVVTINNFVKNMIDIMSHSSDKKYKNIINKYKNKEKYSFIMMMKKDIKSNKMFKCYENDDELIIRKSVNSECLFDTYILIVENYKNIIKVEEKVNDNELFPIIVRLSKKTFATFVGYPMKLWIGKGTKVKELVNRFSISERIQFSSCVYHGINLDLDDVICKYEQGNELLIKFEQKVSFQW